MFSFDSSQFRSFLWNLDPGYFSLKQAIKTVLAILITLWLMRDEAEVTKLLAGVGSGLAIQGVVFHSFRLRFLHVLVFGFFYFSAFVLGLAVRESPIGTAIVLTALGFFVNYIRRFKLENSIAPFMVWVICFLATILPLQNAMVAWKHIYGLIAGLFVSALVTLFVFPQNYSRLFIKNTNLFFHSLSEGLMSLRRSLLTSTPLRGDALSREKTFLVRLTDSNFTIQNSPHLLPYETEITHVITHQYAIMHAYFLLLDATQGLLEAPLPMTRSDRITLVRSCKSFADFLSRTQIEDNFKIPSRQTGSLGIKLLPIFSECELKDSERLINLLNFKLGLSLLRQHLHTLLRGADET